MTTSASPFMESAEIAEMLSALAGTDVVPVDGGFRVKETETHYVDVLRMIFNWRVARTPKDRPWSYDRHWCFAGTSFTTLLRAVSAVAEWDAGDGTGPAGWSKNGQTSEWREPESWDAQQAEPTEGEVTCTDSNTGTAPPAGTRSAPGAARRSAS
jgi:hypothetical protein